MFPCLFYKILVTRSSTCYVRPLDPYADAGIQNSRGNYSLCQSCKKLCFKLCTGHSDWPPHISFGPDKDLPVHAVQQPKYVRNCPTTQRRYIPVYPDIQTSSMVFSDGPVGQMSSQTGTFRQPCSV